MSAGSFKNLITSSFSFYKYFARTSAAQIWVCICYTQSCEGAHFINTNVIFILCMWVQCMKSYFNLPTKFLVIFEQRFIFEKIKSPELITHLWTSRCLSSGTWWFSVLAFYFAFYTLHGYCHPSALISWKMLKIITFIVIIKILVDWDEWWRHSIEHLFCKSNKA